MQYWLAKSEPEEYGWDDLSAVDEAMWDGVRNYAARNNMQAMEVGDPVFIYHSGKKPEIVGIALVSKTAFPDPKDDTETWSAVKLQADRLLSRPVTLKEIKSNSLFQSSSIVKNSRLSVHQLTKEEYEEILSMSGS